MHNIPTPSQIMMIGQMKGAIANPRQPSQSMISLSRVKNLAELAYDERHKTARYSIVRLATEFQRQCQIIAKKGGVPPEEKSRLQSLTLDCMTKLQLVNVQLNDRLIEILLR